MEKLEGFLDRKRLELNTGKTKIVRFRKGGGREAKKDWRWKGKRIEEVNEYKYLGYMLQKNGGQEAQIREKRRKRLCDRYEGRENLGRVGVGDCGCLIV